MEKSVKERAEKYGVEALFDSEAFSLLTGIKEETLEGFKSIKELKERYLNLTLTTIQRQKLEAFFELCKRVTKQEDEIIQRIKVPKDAYDLVKWDMVDLKKEQFRIILLNTKCKVIGMRMISEGSLSSSIVHPREVFKEAIMQSAHSIIAIHNHPSGDTMPSKEDIAITKRLKEVGETVGIPMLDHVIVGSQGYKSLKEEGYF